MVSVSDHPSHGGSYKGIDQMGPIWSIQAMKAYEHKHPRLLKLNPATPFIYKLTLSRDGGNVGEQHDLDSISVERHYIAPYVEEIQVEYGGVKGMLYLPKKDQNDGPSSVPLIIDIPGLGPSAPRDRASLLASHGFGVFDFYYFEALKDDLQTRGMAFFDTELLTDIVNFAKEHPYLDENRIGINGSCYGGTLALNVVCRTPDIPIRCLNLQRSPDQLMLNVGLITLDGRRIQPAGPTADYLRKFKTPDGKNWFEFIFDHMMNDLDFRAESIAAVEKTSIPIMLLICGDDKQCPSEKAMTRVASRIRNAGKDDFLEEHHLEGAGHLLETPYLPLCKASRLRTTFHHEPLLVNWGGETILHAKAQVTAWQKTLDFFRRHLGPIHEWRKDWRDDP